METLNISEPRFKVAISYLNGSLKEGIWKVNEIFLAKISYFNWEENEYKMMIKKDICCLANLSEIEVFVKRITYFSSSFEDHVTKDVYRFYDIQSGRPLKRMEISYGRGK